MHSFNSGLCARNRGKQIPTVFKPDLHTMGCSLMLCVPAVQVHAVLLAGGWLAGSCFFGHEPSFHEAKEETLLAAFAELQISCRFSASCQPRGRNACNGLPCAGGPSGPSGPTPLSGRGFVNLAVDVFDRRFWKNTLQEQSWSWCMLVFRCRLAHCCSTVFLWQCVMRGDHAGLFFK